MSLCSMDGSPPQRKADSSRIMAVSESPPTSIESYKLWKNSSSDSPQPVVARRRGRVGTSDFFQSESPDSIYGSTCSSPQPVSPNRITTPKKDSLSRFRGGEFPQRRNSSDLRELERPLELPGRLKAKISGQSSDVSVTPRYQKLSKVSTASSKYATNDTTDKCLPPVKLERPRSRSLDHSACGLLDLNLVAVDVTDEGIYTDSPNGRLSSKKLIPSINIDRSSLPGSSENISNEDMLPPTRGRSQSQRIYPVSILKCSNISKKSSTVNRYRKHSVSSHVTFSDSPLLIPIQPERRASYAAETVILQFRREGQGVNGRPDHTNGCRGEDDNDVHRTRTKMVSPPPASLTPEGDDDDEDINEEKDWIDAKTVKRRNSLPPLSPTLGEHVGVRARNKSGDNHRVVDHSNDDDNTVMCEVVHSFTPRPKQKRHKKPTPTRKYSLPGKLGCSTQDDVV